MKWYIHDKTKSLRENLKHAVNYYKHLVSGFIGKIEWFVVGDEEALIIVPKRNIWEVGKNEYSLFYDAEDWIVESIPSEDVEMILIENDYILVLKRNKEPYLWESLDG